MAERYGGLALLSAMITPAVLISACGTLIFSTSNRLGRIVDRVRELGSLLQQLAGSEDEFKDERRREFDRQLSSHAARTQLIQRALTSFYAAVGAFVATAVAIALVTLVPGMGCLPSAHGAALGDGRDGIRAAAKRVVSPARASGQPLATPTGQLTPVSPSPQ